MTADSTNPDSENSDDEHDDHDCLAWIEFDEDDVSLNEDYDVEVRGKCKKCDRPVIGQHIIYAIYDPEIEENIYEKPT